MTTTERNKIEEHADLLYSVYCEAVGGVAFNGDPLPEWADFAADPKKQLQSDAWRSVAKQSRELECTLDAACEHIKKLDSETQRLHDLWHAAEESNKFMMAENARIEKEYSESGKVWNRERIRHRKLADASSVLWEEHKAYSEDVHGTEGCDFQGSDSEGHAMMEALVNETLASVSQREAAAKADEKPDGQAENETSAATGSKRNENE